MCLGDLNGKKEGSKGRKDRKIAFYDYYGTHENKTVRGDQSVRHL